MTFIWTYLYRWSRKFNSSKYFVGGNFIIFIFYTIALFRPLFIEDLGRGGGSFATGMYILIITPIHLLLTYIVTILFAKSEKSIKLKQGLLLIGLPLAMLVLGYLIANKINEKEEIKTQSFYENLNREIEKDKIKNSRDIIEFRDFLRKFTSDSIFQKSHTNLPLAIYLLNDSLKVDSVFHYYDYDWKPFLTEIKNITWTFNNWDYLEKKTSERTISRIENNLIIDYNFRFDDTWELFNIKKRKE